MRKDENVSASSPWQLSRRQRAAQLLENVLDEVITPRQAINRWPCVAGVDTSIDTAYQALFHFEADEELQQTQIFYIDAQLELLTQMARYLAHDRPLPAYMVDAYEHDAREHQSGYYSEAGVAWQPFRRLLRSTSEGLGFLRALFGLARQSPQFHRK